MFLSFIRQIKLSIALIFQLLLFFIYKIQGVETIQFWTKGI